MDFKGPETNLPGGAGDWNFDEMESQLGRSLTDQEKEDLSKMARRNAPGGRAAVGNMVYSPDPAHGSLVGSSLPLNEVESVSADSDDETEGGLLEPGQVPNWLRDAGDIDERIKNAPNSQRLDDSVTLEEAGWIPSKESEEYVGMTDAQVDEWLNDLYSDRLSPPIDPDDFDQIFVGGSSGD